MAKETLLNIVQDILSDADSDDVNSISDTVEADQAARCVRTAYDNLMDGADLGTIKTVLKLDATTSATPNIMTRPEGFYDIEWIKYNVKETSGGDQKYQDVTYMTPKDFIDYTSARTASASDVEEVPTDSGHNILVKNLQAPTYWTMFEDYNDIIFDSYDSDLETNLQQSKNLAYGSLKPSLTLADGTIPDLPKNLFNRLKNDARALFFDLYKDGLTPEVDRLRRRSEVRTQRHRHVTRFDENPNMERTGPNYGRK